MQLLKIHEETHVTKRAFACHLCNRRYNFEADLKRHLEKMHQIEPDIIAVPVISNKKSN